MAAGIGSRFGGGIKQLAPVGMHGEIIMDYSIHDAMEAGFNKVIFIIRKDIEEAFREAIGDRIEKICVAQGVEVAYAYQEKEDLPAGVECPADRTKPWGTGQAVLACREILHEPFAVINADDYYGKEAFVKLHDFLKNYTPEQADALCMAGFILKWLSDRGAGDFQYYKNSRGCSCGRRGNIDTGRCGILRIYEYVGVDAGIYETSERWICGIL